MINVDDHTAVMEQLSKAQAVEEDMRDMSVEAKMFINKRDGQWEDSWWTNNHGQPRYTFDMTTTVVNQIYGKIRDADFAAKINPDSSEATEDIAETLQGMVRNIESRSKAREKVYNKAGRNMVISGLDGWRVVQRYTDSDGFEQELAIEYIPNFQDRVWFDTGAEDPDKSDATMCWVFSSLTEEEYEDRFPKGSGEGLTDTRSSNGYFNKPNRIMVGEFYFVKEIRRDRVLMSNGKTYEDNKDFKKVADELLEMGVVEKRRRRLKTKAVYVRYMDASGWLSDPQETVFKHIPVVPVYGNYDVIEDKNVYFGAVEKRIDPQRVLNYTLSREISEGALSPRRKLLMTEKMTSGHEDTLKTMNTNNDAVQHINPDPEFNGGIPLEVGGYAVNPGLRTIADNMMALVTQTAGLFAPNLGDNPNAQSGIAIERLQDKGDVGSYEYIEAMEIAIGHTANIIVEAIPRVYSAGRVERLMYEDGTSEMVTLGEQVKDNETGEVVILNDVSAGKYEVYCSAGPAFQNRQQETVSALVEIGQYMPEILGMSSDILVKNVSAPGMDQVAERLRAKLIQAGMIPVEQLTDEEKEQLMMQMQQQAGQTDPMQLIAEAEAIKAQAGAALDMARVEEAKVGLREKALKLNLDMRRGQIEEMKTGAGIQNDQMRLIMDQQQAIVNNLNTMADTVKKLADAMKAGGPTLPLEKSYHDQAKIVDDIQEPVASALDQ